MVKAKKIGCLILTGLLVFQGSLGTACKKKEETKDTSSTTEYSEKNTEETGDTSSEASVNETEPEPMDPTEKQAKELAQQLGVKEYELHGRYDLFIKYADCVVNNPKLGEWRGYALHFFPSVADHLTEEYEEFFLDKVRNLRMISEPLEDAAGDFIAPGDQVRVYSDGVVCNSDAYYTTLFHELTHFLDAFVSGDEAGELYYTGERFASDEDLTDEERNRFDSFSMKTYYASFITEGGAELYMSKYYGRSPRAYYSASCFLIGFEYILGSKALDDLFFAKDSTMQFIKILQGIGYSDEKICKVIDSFNFETYGKNEQPEGFICFEDVLVDLYEHEKGENWKEDKIFCHILNLIHDGYSYSYETPVPQHEGLKDIIVEYSDMLQWTNSVMNQIPENRKGDFFDLLCVMIHNDKITLQTRVQRTDSPDGYMPDAVEIEYDWDAGKVLSYEYIEFDFPSSVPNPLPAGKELDDRLSSFVRDNAKAHQQTPYAGSSDLKELYERAAELGNKYGVYIYLGENLPDHIERGDASDAASLKTALDQVESVLGRFPDGYFDQFNYGYYSGFEIVLCNWPIMNELITYLTEDGYIFNISLECRNQSNLSQVEDRLLDAIFTATDLKLFNYFENFEDPEFSEVRWSEFNTIDFYYRGYLDEEEGRSVLSELNDNFVSIMALRTAKKDRSQLMTALMESKDLGSGSIKKAEYYSRMIREAFDDSTWPEKTLWEEELAKQMSGSEQKAA
ncbi:MAG: hypothetical protein J6T40_01100 [Clostridiales bacterium]|nr:hypothetical protein [Clostridiales bacterium]